MRRSSAEKSFFRFEASAVSDIGRRGNNEDSWLVDEDEGLFIVADGMGGHDKGEVASRFTAENLGRIVSHLKKSGRHATFDHDEPIIMSVDADDLIKYAILYINKTLYEENEAKIADATASVGIQLTVNAEKKKRMGTTLVSLLFYGRRAYLTHIGDSRAYRVANESIQRLTLDHSFIEEEIREGRLTPEEAKKHEKRNVITRSVGFKKDVSADIDVLTIKPPERLLLCSDGLSNVVDEKALGALAILPDMGTACGRMVELAKERGGRDNITALLIDVSRTQGSGNQDLADNKEDDITDL